MVTFYGQRGMTGKLNRQIWETGNVSCDNNEIIDFPTN